MDTIILGLLIIFLSGFFQGTFGLGMKKFQPLSWEAFWIIFSIVGMLVIPSLFAYFMVPDPILALKSVETKDALIAILYGGLWGVGSLLWGISLIRLGMSLTYGIGMSVTAISGSLGMLLQIEGVTSQPFFIYLMAGTIVMLIGVALITYAGMIREKSKQQDVSEKGSAGKYYLAIVFIIFSGVFSGLLNIGFNRVSSVAEAAIAQGVSAPNASLLQWVYVFIGGFVIQFTYAFVLLIKNRSYVTYKQSKSYKGYIAALLTAIFWFAALGLYGQGSTLMGELGSVVGWAMFVSLSLIVSNVWGFATGEWKDCKKGKMVLSVGVIVILLSTVLLGVSNL